MSVDNLNEKFVVQKKRIIKNVNLQFITSRHGKEILLYNGYTLSQKYAYGMKTNWACRCRNIYNKKKQCRATIITMRNPNGTYNVHEIRTEHSHEPSEKTLNQFKAKALTDQLMLQ